MSSLRTFTAALIAVCLSSPGVSGPVSLTAPAVENDMVRLFASCTGRLSAQIEHQWLMADPGSDATHAQRAHLIELLDTVAPPHAGRQILNWRIDAKQAQSVLLTRATFNRDASDASWARARADREIANCTAMLLS